MLSTQKARALRQKKHREQRRAFLLEGPHAVSEALRAHAELRGVFVTAEAREKHAALLSECERNSVPVRSVSHAEIASLSGALTPQGIVGVCGFCDTTLEDLLQRAPRFLIVGVQLSDPGNVGTLIRVADAAGADGVILSTESVDVYNDKCVRATTGSIFHLPVVRAAPVESIVSALHHAEIHTLGTSSHAQRSVFDVAEAGQLHASTAWFFGSEAHGVPLHVLSALDERVTIPIYGRAESLNLATAVAVCAYTHARSLHDTQTSGSK